MSYLILELSNLEFYEYVVESPFFLIDHLLLYYVRFIILF